MPILIQVPCGLSKKNAADDHTCPYVIPKRSRQFDSLIAL
jgi:hypothetical protein